MSVYTYKGALEAAGKVHWTIDDLIGGDRRLDFSKPFMPEALARVERLGFLTPDERLVLNQIRGAGYLYTFGLVEEFILPFVLDQARPGTGADPDKTRALVGFASEEAKHIELFRRFRAQFEAGFGSPCAMIGPPDAIAKAVLSHHPLAVALVTEHIEWMTQRHYLDSVRDEGDLDPQFKSLLRHHWMEEAQHAKLDALLVEALAGSMGAADLDHAIEDYLRIGGLIDGGLEQQVEFDLASFERKTGRVLDAEERRRFADVQIQALRWTYLGSGMTHPNFLASLEEIDSRHRARIESLAPAFC